MRIFIYLMVCYAAVTAPALRAWSAKGHADIAERALQRLPYEQQQFFIRYADAVQKQESSTRFRNARKRYSSFARMAVWPDTRRDITLQRLFSRFGQSDVPPSLRTLSGFDTSKWHYVNQAYWDASSNTLTPANAKSARCRLKAKGRLAEVWPNLVTAFDEANTPEAKGLVLAFISHLLADAFQPLHTMAAVDDRCRSDAGGNGHCLTAGKKRCQLNLHQLWDRGFNVFDQSPGSASSTSLLNNTHSANAKAGTASALQEKLMAGDTRLLRDLSSVLSLGASHAQHVYSTAEYKKPSRRYENTSADIVMLQRLVAIEALSHVLRQLYFAANGLEPAASGQQNPEAAYSLFERARQWWHNVTQWLAALLRF